ncbi:LacI family DNA-binding transcriptional regulator [Sphingomonas ginkgonis]|uniref:LacI family DNA-binding transcriptional regulator n=1 Tax=Sphingomonas ginkgonis TaxID=2315330 RepID=A0A429VC23_9SPHN|nr:LacI family DNA-binding transcriptional regulator [Sphingomonas ginkgonis]RST31382.1 LacI family DNA-binding transcriptional regulator [Sphingomonas ginkgonis]
MNDFAVKPPGKITIREVAAAAGVSLQTVSRVINKGPNVSDKARRRVEEAVAALGYSPSIAARRMGGSKSYLLLALNDRDRTIETWQLREGTDWVDQMLLGGMLTCAEHGYRLIFELVDTHSDNIERELAGALAALRPDGVILTPPHSDNATIVRLLDKHGVPCARIGGWEGLGGSLIRMDDLEAAARTVEHLAGHGHRRVAFIAGDPEYRLSEERVAGYRAAVERLGLDRDPELLEQGDFGFESGAAATRRLLALDRPPTAIVASSDQMALAVLAVARERDLMVPDALSVVGFDDTPIARTSVPPLTAVSQPVSAMTACAARLLIEGSDSAALPHIINFELAVRASTGPAPRG